YRAARVSGSYGPTTIGLPGGVAAGANVDITGSFTRSEERRVGKESNQLQGPGGKFGQQFWVEIVVSSAGTDGATYVGEGPPTDGTTYALGGSCCKRWSVCDWSTGVCSSGRYRAARVSGSYGPTTIGLPGGVAAGANVDITGSFT